MGTSFICSIDFWGRAEDSFGGESVGSGEYPSMSELIAGVAVIDGNLERECELIGGSASVCLPSAVMAPTNPSALS